MNEPSDDLELLLRWRAGDRTAGGRLIDRHSALVLRFFQTKTGADAEDLVQRTFLRTVERKDSIRDLASFRAYLLATARTVLIDHFRRRTRHGHRFDSLQTSVADLDPSPSRLVAQRRERERLGEALRQIPLELQVALELYYWEGFAGPELAAALELPEGTVRTRLRRARQLLRLLLQDADSDEGGTSKRERA